MALSDSTESSDLLIRENEKLRVKLAEAERKLAESVRKLNGSQDPHVQHEALLKSESRYRTLFDSIDEGFCLIERVGDGAPDAPLDFRYIEANPALTLQSGVSGVVGRTIRQVLGSEAGEWIATFETILRTGEPIRFERKLELNGRVLELYAFRVGDEKSNRVGVLFKDISQRKQDEAALRDRAQLATLSNLVPQMVWMCTPDGLNVYFNQRWVDYTGMTLEESYGKGWNTPFHPDDKQAAWAAWNRAVETGEQYRVESRLRAADGSYRWFLMRGEPLRSPSGLAERWFGTCTDIDDIKKSEQVVRENAHLLALALEAGQSGFFDWDLVNETTRWSPELERLYGIGPGVFKGTLEQWRAWVVPEDLPVVEKCGREAIRTGKLRGEWRIIRQSDGAIRWLSAHGTVLHDDSGKPIRLVGINVDITERKLLEGVIEEERRLLDIVINRMPAAVLLAEGEELRIRLANPAYQAFAPGKEMVGKTLADVWPEIGPEVPELWRRVLATGEPYSVLDQPFQIRRSPDGPLEQTYFNWSVARIRLPGSADWALLNTAIETTARKVAEEALIRSEKLASVGRMASTIAHEINNPLEAIGNAVFLAQTGPETSEETRKYLDLATQELDRVASITRQTLAFHHQTSTPTLIDLRQSIDGALQIFAPRLKTREIEVMRRTREVGRILGFGGEIQQVISNLLSNSMDALPKRGRIALRLSQMSRSIDGCAKVRFTIADSGSGIPTDRLARIFEPFFTTKELHGTGLGLWVVRQIVERHGAKIRVRSNVGKGTVFSIVFPIADATDARS